MKNRKGFANILLIALVVVLAGALGYVALVKKTPAPAIEPDSSASGLPPLASTTVSTPAQTVSPTAGWKTYTNAEYGFEVKYPNNLVQSESVPAGVKEVTFNISGKTVFSIAFFSNRTGLFGSDWHVAQTKTISGAITTTLVRETEVAYWFDSKNFGLLFEPPSFSGIDQITLSQILSTFKFIEPTAAVPADWKTYTNTQYGFEFKYPPPLQNVGGNSISTSFYYCSGKKVDRGDAMVCSDGTEYNIGASVYQEGFNPENLERYYDSPPKLSNGASAIKKIIVNGKDFYFGKNSVYTTTEWLVHAALGESNTIFMTFSGNAYMTSPGVVASDRDLSEIEKVLFTFKFTASDPTAGWKIYRNTKYGYEIRYPPNAKIGFFSMDGFHPASDTDSEVQITTYLQPEGCEGSCGVTISENSPRAIKSRVTKNPANEVEIDQILSTFKFAK